MKTFLIILTCIFLMTLSYGNEINWHRYEAQTISYVQNYLRIDTTNPPGNENKAVYYLEKVLKEAGIKTIKFEPVKGRGVLYAKLYGNGEKRPLILTHHMDVVPAEKEKWTVPPFSGEIKHGYVWGRGAIDMKTMGMIHLMLLKILKENNIKLNRDIIFLAVCDEESDSLGMRWFVKNKKELIKDAEFAINEGETITVTEGKPDFYGISTGEKSPLWIEMTAHGEPGHASKPAPDSAVLRLIRALNRIINVPDKVKLTKTVEIYLTKVGYANLREMLDDPAGVAQVLSNPYTRALLTNTISITQLKGSNKINSHPNTASAGLDCRLLPGEKPENFMSYIKEIVKDNKITFQIKLQEISAESRPDTELFRVIKQVALKREPNAVVLPVMLTSSNDNHYLRELGITTYGFEPYRLGKGEDRSHGNDERISVENVKFALRFLFEVLCNLGQIEKTQN
ncbi:MAG: M20/M25/M40 family metallo-hydrolase [Elusimicrobiota bacterium]